MRLRARPLSASVWRWHRDGTEWTVDEVITIPAEPADAADLPPALQPFGAVPPLVTDIDLRRRSTPTPPREGSPSTSASSHGGSSSTVVACTRCACRAATPRRTLTATADAGKRTGDPRLGLSPPDMTGRGSSTKQKPWIARDVDVYALSPWCWRGWSAGLAVLGHGEQYGGCF